MNNLNEVVFKADDVILEDKFRFCWNEDLLGMEYDKNKIYPKFGMIHWSMFERSNDNEVIRCI